jgi:hypothetical protein
VTLGRDLRPACSRYADFESTIPIAQGNFEPIFRNGERLWLILSHVDMIVSVSGALIKRLYCGIILRSMNKGLSLFVEVPNEL